MVNCRWRDHFKTFFGLNYRKFGTGRSPTQKAAADPVLQLPVIPVRRGVIAEKALNRRHTLSSRNRYYLYGTVGLFNHKTPQRPKLATAVDLDLDRNRGTLNAKRVYFLF